MLLFLPVLQRKDNYYGYFIFWTHYGHLHTEQRKALHHSKPHLGGRLCQFSIGLRLQALSQPGHVNSIYPIRIFQNKDFLCSQH